MSLHRAMNNPTDWRFGRDLGVIWAVAILA